MAASLDLAILDTGTTRAVALARVGPHFAVGTVECDEELDALLHFRLEIDRALRGDRKRPTDQELTRFGERLFKLVMTGPVRDLFAEVDRGGNVHLHFISNHPKLQSLPWEFIREPQWPPGPNRDRSIVRVHLGRCKEPPGPPQRGKPLRVVLAYAEPRGLHHPVPWPEVEHKMRLTFQARMPQGMVLDVVRAATVDLIQDAVAGGEQCHILHFLGHGEVRNGEGFVLLSDDDLSASDLALLLGGCGIRMVVLSACDTSSGDFRTDFAVTAETLLVAGIPVVLANQLPLPTTSVAPFVGTFYRTLLTTGDIDRAVAEARIGLRLMLPTAAGEASIEWGIPTLYRAIGSDQFFAP